MRKILKAGLVLLLILLAAISIYVIYVFMDYYRLEDRLPLDAVNSAQAEDAPKVNTPLRIASYNIGFGAYSDDYSFFMDGGKESRARSKEAVLENVNGAMDAIQKVSPDLVFLQEVDADGDRSWHVDERELIYSAFPDYSHVYAQNYDSPYLFWPITEPHGANKAGQITLSKFPISSALRRSLPIEDGVMKFVDLDRCYTVSRVTLTEGKELVLYNFHLSAYTSDGIIAEEQLKMLFGDMLEESVKGNYVIAGGDFNKDILGDSPSIFGVGDGGFTWAQPIPAELIPEEFSIVAPFNPEAPIASCRNADRPYGPDNYLLTVDGFIVSNNVKVVDSYVIDTGFRWSDHNPVAMDFILQ